MLVTMSLKQKANLVWAVHICKFDGKELGKELWETICSDKQLKLFVNEKSYEELKRNGKDLMREGCDGKVWEERM